MKRISLFIFIFLLSTFVFYTKSEISINYFRDIFSKSGVELCTSDYGSPVCNWNLFLISQTTGGVLSNDSFYVCDDEFENTNIRCDESEIIVKSGFLLETLSENPNVVFARNSNNTFIIPETLLTDTEKKEIFEKFIRSFSITQDNIENSSKLIDSEAIDGLFDSSLFNITILFLVFLVFVVLLEKILIEKNAVIFGKKPLDTLFYALLFLLLVIGFVLLLFSYVVSMGDLGEYDFAYFLAYLKFSLNPNNLAFILEFRSYFRILIFAISLLFVGNVLVLGTMFAVYVSVKLKAKKKEYFNTRKIVFIAFAILLSTFFNNGANIAALQAFLIMVALIGLLFSRGLNHQKLVRYKIVILFVFLSVLVVLVQYNNSKKMKLESLINTDVEIVLFPYIKEDIENKMFKEEIISFNYPIFLDDYLIYFPRYSVVKNRLLNNFDHTGSYVVYSDSKKKLAEAYLYNIDFRDVFVRENPTAVFYFDEDFVPEGDLQLSISFDCSLNIEQSDIKIRAYFDEQNGLGIRSVSREVINFPGCISNEDILTPQLEEFTASFSLPIRFNSEKIFVLEGIEELALRDFSLNYEGRNLNIVYLAYEDDFYIENLEDTEDIRFYTSENIAEKTFSYRDQIYDISIPINELIEVGLLKNDFKIYSLSDFIVFKSRYLSN